MFTRIPDELTNIDNYQKLVIFVLISLPFLRIYHEILSIRRRQNLIQSHQERLNTQNTIVLFYRYLLQLKLAIRISFGNDIESVKILDHAFHNEASKKYFKGKTPEQLINSMRHSCEELKKYEPTWQNFFLVLSLIDFKMVITKAMQNSNTWIAIILSIQLNFFFFGLIVIPTLALIASTLLIILGCFSLGIQSIIDDITAIEKDSQSIIREITFALHPEELMEINQWLSAFDQKTQQPIKNKLLGIDNETEASLNVIYKPSITAVSMFRQLAENYLRQAKESEQADINYNS